MNEKQLSEMIIRLFESKCKSYTTTTIKVWVDELKNMNNKNNKYIAQAIKSLIYSSDDFPSIGKIVDIIEPMIEIDMKIERIKLGHKNGNSQKHIQN